MSNYPSYPAPPQIQPPRSGNAPGSPGQSSPRSQPPAAPVRNRRADRHKSRHKKRKKTVFWTLSWWQGVILALLGVGIILGIYSQNSAQSRLRILLEDRDSARRAYEREVNDHRDRLQYRDTIEYYAAVNGIDPAFVSAVIKRESDFDPNAVSRLGARGLMQIMPENREWLAGKIYKSAITDADMFVPDLNIEMGCWYLGYLSRMFEGDPVLVASAYHAGQNNVKSWLTKYSPDGVHLTVDQIPTDDTRYYAGKVLNAYAIYQQHVFTN